MVIYWTPSDRYRAHGIQTTLVCPGLMTTKMFENGEVYSTHLQIALETRTNERLTFLVLDFHNKKKSSENMERVLIPEDLSPWLDEKDDPNDRQRGLVRDLSTVVHQIQLHVQPVRFLSSPLLATQLLALVRRLQSGLWISSTKHKQKEALASSFYSLPLSHPCSTSFFCRDLVVHVYSLVFIFRDQNGCCSQHSHDIQPLKKHII